MRNQSLGKHASTNPQQGKKTQFSKSLLVQESILIWIHTISMIVLAYICVFKGYYSELPWLTAMVAFPWGAYGVSQHAYYKKAEKENTKDGIIFETAMLQNYGIDADG